MLFSRDRRKSPCVIVLRGERSQIDGLGLVHTSSEYDVNTARAIDVYERQNWLQEENTIDQPHAVADLDSKIGHGSFGNEAKSLKGKQ